MREAQIKIGHQKQADLPIFLRASGVLVCGRYKYRGPMRNQFRALYRRLLDLVPAENHGEILDVSQYQFWDAARIYDELVVARWARSLSAKQLEKLAMETTVFLLLEPVRAEFNRAVGRRWRKVVKTRDTDDPNWPRHGWQIL